MAVFGTAYNLTMKHEGGYAKHPNDTGGETYKGISRKHSPNWSGWTKIDAIKKGNTVSQINVAALKDASLQESVKAFYLDNYWNINSLTKINDQQLAENVFDFGVNAGTIKAAKALQQAYNDLSVCDITVDGVIGNKTLAAVNLVNPKIIYDRYNVLRKAHYDNIIANNPSQSVFKGSWYSRLIPYKQLV